MRPNLVISNEPSEQKISLEPKVSETSEERAGYLTWPLLPELLPVSFSGLRPGQDDLQVDIDRERLARSIKHALTPTNPPQNIVRFCYQPFDLRWAYIQPQAKLTQKKQSAYFSHLSSDNLWLALARRNRRTFELPFVTRRLCSRQVIESGARLFPLRLRLETEGTLFAHLPGQNQPWPNLSKKAGRYLVQLEVGDVGELLFYHVLAILYAPQYRRENNETLQQDWPRLPLPNTAKLLQKSVTLGQKIAALLDMEKAMPGVTTGQIRPELKMVGVLSRVESDSLEADSDLAMTAGWGSPGRRGKIMPGQGYFVERAFSPDEQAAIERGAATLGLSLDQLAQVGGSTTLDVYLNQTTFWANIPLKVWNYPIGGYTVLKKWLSYRDQTTLGRPLKPEEAQEITSITRRILALILLEPALDANYRAVKRAAYVDGRL